MAMNFVDLLSVVKSNDEMPNRLTLKGNDFFEIKLTDELSQKIIDLLKDEENITEWKEVKKTTASEIEERKNRVTETKYDVKFTCVIDGKQVKTTTDRIHRTAFSIAKEAAKKLDSGVKFSKGGIFTFSTAALAKKFANAYNGKSVTAEECNKFSAARKAEKDATK